MFTDFANIYLKYFRLFLKPLSWDCYFKHSYWPKFPLSIVFQLTIFNDYEASSLRPIRLTNVCPRFFCFRLYLNILAGTKKPWFLRTLESKFIWFLAISQLPIEKQRSRKCSMVFESSKLFDDVNPCRSHLKN